MNRRHAYLVLIPLSLRFRNRETAKYVREEHCFCSVSGRQAPKLESEADLQSCTTFQHPRKFRYGDRLRNCDPFLVPLSALRVFI